MASSPCSLEQVQIPLNITAMAPFVAEPRLQLGYQVEGHGVGRSLALPVALTKFCSPPDAPLPRDLFFSQWRALAGASPPLARYLDLLQTDSMQSRSGSGYGEAQWGHNQGSTWSSLGCAGLGSIVLSLFAAGYALSASC